jgi:hypothetical protein
LALGMRSSRGRHLALSLLAITWIASPADAQVEETPAAVIRLIGQTAWTTPKRPLIRITVDIANESDSAIIEPRVVWQLGSKVISRVQYETALVEGPASTTAADTVFLTGDLEPDASIEVPVTIDTSETEAIEDDSGVYPLQLELRSGEQVVASMTTAVIHIVQDPEKPVLFSWWTEVTTPIAFGPDGTLIDRGFEDALASGGGIVAQVEAIHELLRVDDPGVAVDLVIAPIALDQLERIADGYERPDGTSVPGDAPAPRAAADTLERLVEIASSPRARLHAMPFAAPRLPALLASGLKSHLEAHWRLGDETFERVLGERPDPTVARSPGLAFDQSSINAMAARGATTILGGADSVDRPSQDNDLAPPPAALLDTPSGGEVTLLLPDPGATSLLDDPDMLEDPILAAQVLLGELATIWKERPVPPPPEQRGLALDLPPELPAAFWHPAVRRLSRAPFLESVQAEDLRGGVKPPPATTDLGATAPQVFSASFADDLAATARRINAFGAIVEEPAGEADRLRRALLYAEASQYIRNEGSARAWLSAANGVIDRTFDRLAPDTSRVLTFTSRSGLIPLRMGDPGDRVVQVTVKLASGRVEFLHGTQDVRLDRPDQVITFQAEVKAAGPSRIDVFVMSPNGVVLSRRVLVVSSTAINPIALLITIGAGLVLVGLWSRRLFRRRSQ